MGSPTALIQGPLGGTLRLLAEGEGPFWLWLLVLPSKVQGVEVKSAWTL